MHRETTQPPSRFGALRAAALALGLLALLCAAACGGGAGSTAPTVTASQTPVPATATPVVTPTPDPAVLLRDGGIGIIQTAFGRLVDEYIHPPDEAALLSAGWGAASSEARTEGHAVPAAPAINGDRAHDFAAFAAAYGAMTSGLPDPKDIRFAAIRGMAASLNDCHTFFLNPVASDTLVGSREGNGSVGIGVELAGVPPLVTEVIPGGPADRAGILVGDRLSAIDGKDASAFGPASAFDLINGTEGTSVRLALRRPSTGATLALTLERERVVPPNVTSRLLPGGIGYVRVREFIDGGIAAGLKDALADVDAQGATAWIIDMRDNPGGRLDTAAISLFVPSGVIVRDEGRDGQPEQQSANGAVLSPLRPTVLLTDNRTGSVAEVFAAALQEYHAAYLVGARTNGCVGFTDLRPLGDGSSLAVTTDVNLGPVTNAPLNGVGVTPDEQVARTNADIAAGRDPQLDAAVAHLSRR